ncbi:PilT protein domain protein [Gloeocapsa sp. PCC 7428]|uniref:PIN domain-containing protein n=1 Tax=Gloeocapsa sp. PCC 7428 TaxID=1173026 RepID=UPI0002A60A6D|nr:PIN domain-containing protein [Gloeocapsa sp. PCC 7428]AFZ30343.1 PilT protein domain protein [Gloeocapsa sp. PCC 7428]
MRILIDTNIILDYLLQREPFCQKADLLFQAIASGQIVGYVTVTTLTDIFYIARRHTGSIEQARQAISETLTAMVICPVNRAVLESAFASDLTDFEDAIQLACAVTQELDALTTRDTGFSSRLISVLTVGEVLQQLEANE